MFVLEGKEDQTPNYERVMFGLSVIIVTLVALVILFIWVGLLPTIQSKTFWTPPNTVTMGRSFIVHIPHIFQNSNTSGCFK